MFVFSLLLICMFVAAPAPEPEPGLIQHMTRLAVADTIQAGEVFISNLPDSIDGIPSDRYEGVELPTRSWLRNQTFFWRTSESDRGDHALWFYVFREADTDVPADSVAIHVTIR